MKSLSLFLKLTEVTVPSGHEAYCYSFIPQIDYIDEKGNVWAWIMNPDGTSPSTMFSSHLDTVGYGIPQLTGAHIKKSVIRSGGKTVLGADDKTGVVLMIKLMEHKTPGLYVFHTGEESGGKGSGWLSEFFCKQMNAKGTSVMKDRLWRIKRCIAFDRRGTQSIITHQGGTRTCSDVFANALAAQLGMGHKIDTGGSFTDSKNYKGMFSECTNVSAGYYNEHSNTENLDWAYFDQLVAQVLKVKWDELPAERDFSKDESLYSGRYSNTGNTHGMNKTNAGGVDKSHVTSIFIPGDLVMFRSTAIGNNDHSYGWVVRRSFSNPKFYQVTVIHDITGEDLGEGLFEAGEMYQAYSAVQSWPVGWSTHAKEIKTDDLFKMTKVTIADIRKRILKKLSESYVAVPIEDKTKNSDKLSIFGTDTKTMIDTGVQQDPKAPPPAKGEPKSKAKNLFKVCRECGTLLDKLDLQVGHCVCCHHPVPAALQRQLNPTPWPKSLC